MYLWKSWVSMPLFHIFFFVVLSLSHDDIEKFDF